MVSYTAKVQYVHEELRNRVPPTIIAFPWLGADVICMRWSVGIPFHTTQEECIWGRPKHTQ